MEIKEDYTLSLRLIQVITEREFMFTSLDRNNELLEQLVKGQQELVKLQRELFKEQQELVKEVRSLFRWQTLLIILVFLNSILNFWIR